MHMHDKHKHMHMHMPRTIRKPVLLLHAILFLAAVADCMTQEWVTMKESV